MNNGISLHGSRFDIERALMEDETASASARLVLMALLVRANGATGILEEKYTPTLAKLAKMTHLSENTVAAALKELEAAGWLTVRRPTLAERARRKKNVYTFLTPRRSATAPERAAKRASTRTAAATAVVDNPVDDRSHCAATTAATAGLNTKNNKNNPPVPHHQPAAAVPAARLRRGEGHGAPEPQATPADALLARLHPQLEHEHVSRWTRARWRRQLEQAAADGWKEADLLRELTKDVGNARTVAGVVDFRLRNLGPAPKATPTPPPYAAQAVPVVHAETVRAHQRAAREALAAVRAKVALVPSPAW